MHECKRCGTPWEEHDGPCEDYLELAKQAATITELRAEIDTLAKAWRKAEDENDELRAEVERLRDLLRAPAREVTETQRARAEHAEALLTESITIAREQRDRADRAEADLAEAVAVMRELDDALADFEPESGYGSYQQVRGHAAALLTKVKP